MEKASLSKKLRTLFFSNLIISACTFGGGAVIIPNLQKKYVEELKWIEQEEMMDMVAIAQSAPGVMAVNTAIMIGYKIAGIIGVLVSVLGAVLPPMIILSIISYAYDAFASSRVIALILKGMEAGVAAVILNVSISMLIPVVKKKNILYDILFVIGLGVILFLNVSATYVIAACAAISIIYTIIVTKKQKKEGKQ